MATPSMLPDQTKQLPEGLPILQNWKARNAGKQRLTLYEFPLFTDARITGQIQLNDWPYEFLNTVPLHDAPGFIQAPVIVRVSVHLPSAKVPDLSKTNTTLYHGGLLNDEIAALASLCVGIRMKAGGESRRFDDLEKNPLGQPVAWGRRPPPTLNINRNGLVLPDLVKAHSLEGLERLADLLNLSTSQSVALVRAARLYQDALWIVESEPALAWLMLVSALETAANQWRSENGSPAQRLKYSKPELSEILTNAGGDALVNTVANLIEPSLGATKKFVDFSLEFIPPPPAKRPNEPYQIPWNPNHMKKVLSIVYMYRSKALHGGTPFPAPMCNRPFYINASEGYTEKGTIGLAEGSHGASWLEKDVPINLYTFHYIVRQSLLNWWKFMAEG